MRILWILYNLLKFVFLLSIGLMLLVFMFWDVSSPKLPGQRNVSLSEALLLTCYELLGERSCLMIATSHTVKRYIRNDPSVVKDALQFLSSCRINPQRKLPAVLKEFPSTGTDFINNTYYILFLDFHYGSIHQKILD